MRLQELLDEGKKKKKKKRKGRPGIDYVYKAPPAKFLYVGRRMWGGIFGGLSQNC